MGSVCSIKERKYPEIRCEYPIMPWLRCFQMNNFRLSLMGKMTLVLQANSQNFIYFFICSTQIAPTGDHVETCNLIAIVVENLEYIPVKSSNFKYTKSMN